MYSITAVVNKFNVVPFFVGFRFFLMFGDYFETDNILATYRNSLLFVIISYRNVIFAKSAVTRAEFIFFYAWRGNYGLQIVTIHR